MEPRDVVEWLLYSSQHCQWKIEEERKQRCEKVIVAAQGG
jgi:hypothetical protein